MDSFRPPVATVGKDNGSPNPEKAIGSQSREARVGIAPPGPQAHDPRRNQVSQGHEDVAGEWLSTRGQAEWQRATLVTSLPCCLTPTSASGCPGQSLRHRLVHCQRARRPAPEALREEGVKTGGGAAVSSRQECSLGMNVRKTEMTQQPVQRAGPHRAGRQDSKAQRADAPPGGRHSRGGRRVGAPPCSARPPSALGLPP